LGEAHRQILIPTRESSKACITSIAAHAFLELVPGKVLHELSENGLANVHYSLSRAVPPCRVNQKTPRKTMKQVQIEKSQIRRNPLIYSSLFVVKKV
jgi:hypothetical protein